MPSLSTTADAAPAFPASSEAATSIASDRPAVTATVARHVPAWAEPALSVAATPFTATRVTPRASDTWTATAVLDAVINASGDGDTIRTSGAVVSRTRTCMLPVVVFPDASVALQVTT